MSISDAEFNYNKTEEPFGEFYQQFQFIMNTEKILNLEEIEDINVLNKSQNVSSIYSDDDDDEKIISKNIINKNNFKEEDDQNDNEKFIEIEYNLISAENKQNVNISIEKFKFCFPLTSLARLYQFYLYFFGLYLKSMNFTMQYKKKEIIDKERELIKQKILSGEIKIDDDDDKINVIKEENEDENEINKLKLQKKKNNLKKKIEQKKKKKEEEEDEKEENEEKDEEEEKEENEEKEKNEKKEEEKV